MNIKMVIEYDGHNYYGWQKQLSKPTIQGTIEQALAKILGEKVKIIGASRTDAGVSALAQVANCQITTKANFDLEKLTKSINALLPKDIYIKSISRVKDGFNARRDAKSKIYTYTIITSPSPLRGYFAWCVPYQLDVKKMREGAKLFIANRNYADFCAERKNGLVAIKKITINRKSDTITISIEANRFLYKMVRRIVGALVEIGRAHRELEDIQNALKGKKHRPLICAPAQGLILSKVKY
ncbi:MAG: tRNA pseudouridine(38-40) synthase TruA [candidate division WOR-3 bacterium]